MQWRRLYSSGVRKNKGHRGQVDWLGCLLDLYWIFFSLYLFIKRVSFSSEVILVSHLGGSCPHQADLVRAECFVVFRGSWSPQQPCLMYSCIPSAGPSPRRSFPRRPYQRVKPGDWPPSSSPWCSVYKMAGSFGSVFLTLRWFPPTGLICSHSKVPWREFNGGGAGPLSQLPFADTKG